MLRCKQSGVRGRSVLGVSLDRVVSKETLPPGEGGGNQWGIWGRVCWAKRTVKGCELGASGAESGPQWPHWLGMQRGNKARRELQ